MARAVKNADGSYSVKFEVTITGPEKQLTDLVSNEFEVVDAIAAGVEDYLEFGYGVHLGGRFVVFVEEKS